MMSLFQRRSTMLANMKEINETKSSIQVYRLPVNIKSLYDLKRTNEIKFILGCC